MQYIYEKEDASFTFYSVVNTVFLLVSLSVLFVLLFEKQKLNLFVLCISLVYFAAITTTCIYFSVVQGV